MYKFHFQKTNNKDHTNKSNLKVGPYIYMVVPVIAISILAIFIIYNFIYSSKIFPNVFLSGSNFGGFSANSAYIKVDDIFDNFLKADMKFSFGENISDSKIEDWGITLDSEATTKNLYEIGRSGNITADSYFRLKTLISKTNIEPVYKINSLKFSAKFNQMFAKYNTEAVGATLVFIEGDIQIKSESNGETVDLGTFIDNLRKNISNLRFETIEIQTIVEEPRIHKENLVALQQKVNALTKQEIVLNFAEDSWRLTNSNLFDMFRFYPVGYEDKNLVNLDLGDNILQVKSINANEADNLTLSIHLDDQMIDSYILDISRAIDRSAKDATLKFENGKVSEFSPAQDGQRLNRSLLIKQLSDILDINNIIADKQITVELPVLVAYAKIANDEINTLGIKELIGKGVSYFAHSIPNRAWNVGLGTSRVSGTLVGPGEIFSFNNAVGEVTGATGYRKAYIISAGKTVLDDGGGICQVSTTVFRAALNAGFPIVSRTAHAYRVGYYEQNNVKPGFDATVFSPSVDLQFKNDTQNSILVQAVVNEKISKLEVDIYGTSDGRRVELGNSIVSNPVPALPDRRQDDPTLPVGEIKQVDFAAAGATAIFTRKVYRGNELLFDDVFKSVYRPWAAVYLVGTKS